MPDIFVDLSDDVYRDVSGVIINRAVEKLKNSPIRDTSKKGKWQEIVVVDDIRYVVNLKAINDLHVIKGFRRTRKQ